MTSDLRTFQKDSSDAGLRLVADNADVAVELPLEKQFVNFMFLRVSPEWRKLDADTKTRLKADFTAVFEHYRGEFLLHSYSLVGFDSKADLMFWRIGPSLDVIQDMTAQLFRTELGSYIETTDNYLSVTKKMMFVGRGDEDRSHILAGSGKYHFVYPCAKHKDWYNIPADERDSMIEENYMVGKKFPNIRIHLTHAFGFTENEYLISFETDEPRDFLALAEELRHAPAAKFTMRGMPVYTCRQRTLDECLDSLG